MEKKKITPLQTQTYFTYTILIRLI